LMLLMLNVATLTKSLSVPVPLGAPRKRSNRAVFITVGSLIGFEPGIGYLL
jgi:hypothetical protein